MTSSDALAWHAAGYAPIARFYAGAFNRKICISAQDRSNILK